MRQHTSVRRFVRLAVTAAAVAGAAVVILPAAEVGARVIPGEVTILDEASTINAPQFSIAYNPDAGNYLAVWRRSLTTHVTEIAGVILDADGTPQGAPIDLAVGTQAVPLGDASRFNPVIEYNPAAKEYLLVYALESTVIAGRRISATGQPVGTGAAIDDRSGYGFGCSNAMPDVAADPATGGYVLVYSRTQVSTTPNPCEGTTALTSDIVVQTLSAGLTPGEGVDVPQSTFFTNPAYITLNPVTGTFLVTHSASEGQGSREYGHIYDSELQPVGGSIPLVYQVANPGQGGGSYVATAFDPASGNWIALVNNTKFEVTQMNIVSPTGQVLSNAPVVRRGGVSSLGALGDGTILLSTASGGTIQQLRQDGTEIYSTSTPLANGNGVRNALATNGDPVDSKAVIVGMAPTGSQRIASAPIDIFDPGPLPLPPARLLDTREGAEISTVDGLSKGGGKRTAGNVVVLKVAGRGGVPADADAVLLNVTSAGAMARGYVTAYPCDAATRPTTSNLNYSQGGAASAAAIVKVSNDGTVCLFTFAESHLIADVNGYVPAGGSVTSLVPARLLETRQNNRTVDGKSNGIGRVAANSTTTLLVAGRGGVSAGADAVLVNVAAVNPNDRAFLTVYPCDADRPTASNLNVLAGDVANNLVTSKVSATGTICVFASAETDLVVDVAAFVPDGGGLLSIVPARLLETRNGPGNITVDGQSQGSGRVEAGSVTELRVDRGGVAERATGVMLNVAAIAPSDGGFMTVYPFPCNGERPTASNVNFAAGTVVSNAVFVKVSDFDLATGNYICIYSSAEAHLAVDVVGYTVDS